MACAQQANAQPLPVFWVASCPQPMVAPVCFDSNVASDGAVAWSQPFAAFSMPSQFACMQMPSSSGSAAMDWALCMPLHCMGGPVAPCTVLPNWCSAQATVPMIQDNLLNTSDIVNTEPNTSGAEPMQAEFEHVATCVEEGPSSGLQPAGLMLFPPDTTTASSDLVLASKVSNDVIAMTSCNSDASLQWQCPAVGRWADEPIEQEEVLVASSSSSRRRRRQRDVESSTYSEASAPSQQVMTSCVTREGDDVCEGARRTCCQSWADWLVAQLGAGGRTRAATVANAYHLATSDKSSSRALQLALQSAPSKDAAALALGLRGHVREIIWSMHGNYVLQKVIEVVPASIACFIVQELLGVAAEVARHRFGCRVLCRLLEHQSSSDHQTCSLVEEILLDAAGLCRHNFGNFVIQHILEFGLAAQKHAIATALCEDISDHARNAHASHAIEKALCYCCDSDRDTILENLVYDPTDLLKIAEHASGCFVVRALLKLPQEHLSKVEDRLSPIMAQLSASNRRQRRFAAAAADRAGGRASHPLGAK